MCRACLTGPPVWRLPLASGGRVFMDFHSYFGPSFYRDHRCAREIEQWYEDAEIVAALDWFIARGKMA
jgi:hypothetical protein